MVKKIYTLESIPKIEGHLNFTVIVEDNKVVKAQAEALEGVRLLERLLIGKKYYEIPDITSRMCGVCQAIHKVTAVQAVEKALDIQLPETLNMLRELVVIGGHLQSHILHLYAFVLPDFLGYKSIIDMLPKHKKTIKKIFMLKKLANNITEIIGGRAVHPITPIVGGFSRLPSRHELEITLNQAKEFKRHVNEIAELILSIEMPKLERKTKYVSLYNGKDIPLLSGSVKIYNELVFNPEEYEQYLESITETYSMARHYLIKTGKEPYMVGALARLNNNHAYLSDAAKELAKKYSVKFPSYSTFDNNKAQALELVHYIEKAMEINETLLDNIPRVGRVKYKIKEGNGVSITEAPRGLLIHHYKVDANGNIQEANIITPTAQNYKNMEADATAYLPQIIINKKKEEIEFELEKLIRAYDPCVSCSARFYREH